ncbi:MAG TPA: DUF5989 family protein [Pirellulales bacterium]|jgi:hypothetical protein|nr:DUF5989 family protein [Pirellulales bacterium]HEV3023493.1 DUF5989 family protein [Pirellulales bacterium]
MSTNPPENQPPVEFERAAAEAEPVGLVREFLGFLAENKKWWLLPIVVMLFVIGLLVWMGGSAAAPFIYTLF